VAALALRAPPSEPGSQQAEHGGMVAQDRRCTNAVVAARQQPERFAKNGYSVRTLLESFRYAAAKSSNSRIQERFSRSRKTSKETQ
jgi:hypothetical protein